MAYPDLPPTPSFWRCPACGNESLFQASGTGHIQCGRCGQASTDQQLVEAHRQAHAESARS